MAFDRIVELLSDDSTPIEHAALEVARDLETGVSIERSLAELASHASTLRPSGNPSLDAARLRARLVGELGFRGNSADYHDPRNSLLHHVIERRLGIPISLAMVWIAVGRRAHMTVEGIGFPAHFLVRVGGPGGVILDVFHGGVALDEEGLAMLAERCLGNRDALRPRHLETVGTAAMVLRMLHNLKAVLEAREDHARALVVCDRLYNLTDNPEHRRDRGQHALALGSHASAEHDLRAYLEARPDASDVRHVKSKLAVAKSGSTTFH